MDTFSLATPIWIFNLQYSVMAVITGVIWWEGGNCPLGYLAEWAIVSF